MNRPLGKYALALIALIVVSVLENAFFGADTGGAKHYISVGFFFAFVAAMVALVGLGVTALVRRVRVSS